MLHIHLYKRHETHRKTQTRSESSLCLRSDRHLHTRQMVLMMVSIAALSRSRNHSKIAKLLTIYFKSCRTSTKAFDTLHALGMTMSQKWVYSAIDPQSKVVRVGKG